jgi:protein TonB
MLDIALGNGPGGFAVAPQAAAAPAAPKAATTSKKTLTAAPAAAKPDEDCPEPPTKPKPKNVLQPSYPEAARAAGISGKVRVEVTVDETGAVKSARVVSGLGHGLDEAALAAARGSTFGPATRCGKSVGGTFVIGMRFSL